MKSRKRVLLSSTVLPFMLAAGVAAGGAILIQGTANKPAMAQCAAKKANPCAAAKCNPCAAAKCNPCAAAKCNPCAAKKCNPCAAAKCNPRAAKKCNPCNPCAAGACNPCNPCAAGGGAVSKACFVPRLQAAAKCNPCAAKKCNPCAAKACNPCAAKKCNPCAAKACNPCNPCAAKKCNPCNPCGAKACNPCNPCGAGGATAELTDAEAVAVYDCLLKELKAAYAKSDNKIAISYTAWPRYSKRAYVSATHGERLVQNYANEKGRAYGAFENAGTFPAGTVLAKDSFMAHANGTVSVGPLFIMEKMQSGFNAESGDWRYTMIMPNGSIAGTTKGAGDANVAFCIGCHISVAPEQDSVMLLPEEYRVR